MESCLSVRLVGLLGPDAVVPVDGYEVDGFTPQAVVRPGDRLQVSEILRWASAEKVSILPRGGGTRMGLGNVPRRAELVMDLGKLDQLVDYQPADMTATVEAGVTLMSLQQQLAPGGEFVPLESALPGRSTVGGTLSVGTGGPLAHAYGLPREWLIGIGVISSQGVATKAGGKVVKNVTGYDLNKLYTGSLGTLGVIVEASFKLLPIDPGAGALIASFPSLSASILAGRKLLHSLAAPLGYHSVTPGVTRRLQEFLETAPFDLGLVGTEAICSLAFYSRRAGATNRRSEEATALLLAEGANAVQRIEGSASNELLRWLTDVPSAMSTNSSLVMKLSVQSKSAEQASAECSKVNLSGERPDQIADPGFGSIRLFWSQASGEPGEEPFLETIQQIRQIAHRHGGSTVVEHCPLPVKGHIDVWGDSPDSSELMRRVKDKFDPGGILNPGRFLGGI